MTSMFFIMLVLFVITIGYLQVKISENERLIEELKIREQGLIQETERLQKLLNLEEQFKPLIDDNSFYYLSDCKKFIVKDLMGIEIFNPNKVVIKPEYISRTISAGKKIDAFLGELSEQNKGFSYLLVIEGNMANDFKKPKPVDRPDFYLKSYERALAVYNLWLKNGINFRQHDVEVMICGSGLNGLCRDPVEENNKRFSIQIIPKVSK
ncbi:MAG: rane protein [Bacteroidetes bacterium]|nr:rane protein [Bacteroidota bacterium]